MMISFYPIKAMAIEHPAIGYLSDNLGIPLFCRIYDALAPYFRIESSSFSNIFSIAVLYYYLSMY